MLNQGHPGDNETPHEHTVRDAVKKAFLFVPPLLVALAFVIGYSSNVPSLIGDLITRPPTITLLPYTSSVTPNNAVWAMIGHVDQQKALTDLRKLTGAEQLCLPQGCYTITNRLTGSEGLQWAKNYVIAQLTGMGYSVQVQDWSSGSYADQNLIIHKSGILQPENEIYFVAHLDGEANAPAADDNGSGVVDLLQLARIIKNRSFNNTLVLLFSTGEEEGALGVHYYVNQLTEEQLEAISYVVDVDMVGYDSNNDGIMELWNGEQPLDFVQLLDGIIQTYHLNLTTQVVSDCS
jgi:hypothetical protein